LNVASCVCVKENVAENVQGIEIERLRTFAGPADIGDLIKLSGIFSA
jgi:hypothetical protein